MNWRAQIVLLAGAAVAASAASGQQRLYRWVDEDGNVHYGDRVPPEYSKRDREVLNEQGVSVGREDGELTAEERAARERERSEAAAEEAARREVAQRDRMLLETYLSVADIEDLRDRRLELLDSQIQVTELYLSDLRKRLANLEAEAERYAPRSDADDARPLPESLAAELEQTRASIDSYEQQIERTRAEQARLRAQFEDDIERFRELKGG